MYYLFTLVVIILLYLKDKQKTKMGIKKGFKKLLKNIPPFLTMIALVAISLSFISEELIVKYLGQNSGLMGIFTASILGSITFMPGCIAFPLAKILVSKGVGYMVIALFTTTLMMVGVLTFPLEKSYFGTFATILRNIFGLIMALLASLAIGFIYGEISL